MIAMIDIVITCVNTFGSDQPNILTFKYRHSRLIGDLKTLGVGANSDEGELEFPVLYSELD